MAFIHAHLKPATPTEFRVTKMHLEHTTREAGRQGEDDWRCARHLSDVISDQVQNAQVVFVEQPVGSQSARASWTLGITLGLLASMPVRVIPLRARKVKQVFTGDAGATKFEMIKQATTLYPKLEWPTVKRNGKREIVASRAEHLADALAVLYTGVRDEQFTEFLAARA